MPDKSVSLSTVRGLTASEVGRLKRAGIDNTKELLAATKTYSAEKKLASATGITQDRMREAVNRADLLRISGVGPALADLFENAGVNSTKELAQRNAAALAVTLQKYVAAHPELNYRLPSPATVATLVAKAKGIAAPAPTTPVGPANTIDDARAPAAAAVHKYIDDVLFSNHPDGQSFRDAVLGWRPSTEWDQVKAKMHEGVNGLVGSGTSVNGALEETYDKPDRFIFSGRLLGLYTEVEVLKADRSVPRVYVEID